jgi:Fic family protein
MKRITGTYKTVRTGDEEFRAFIPRPLPPTAPELKIEGNLSSLLADATSAVKQLSVAGAMVPSAEWFLYGFVRKEAVISSQIEGTQATFMDVVSYEATRKAENPADVQEVCNYVDALEYARGEIAKPKGLPICSRLLTDVHKRLMRGVRGADKQPGTIRTSQNWIGGTRPGNARFVPPPHEEVPAALAALDKWIHAKEPLPPLVRAGMAHVQFETIHPFLDGNGRVGRLLIGLLVEHWKLLDSPLLYLSLAFKRHRDEYYRYLLEVRTEGDWEGWTAFFLECVKEAANDGVNAAGRIFRLIEADRRAIVAHKTTTVQAVRLFDLLPENPMVTIPSAIKLLNTTKPTAMKAVDAIINAGVLHEITGRRRDRVYAYRKYLDVLTEDTDISAESRSIRLQKTLNKTNRKYGKALRRLDRT